MQTDTAALRDRLEHFDLDIGTGGSAFTERLARENGWTLRYARRACSEYKRFALLAVTSDELCTPSDQVDQVWHLHLIHTRAYWQGFCGEVLGTELHHAPSLGGARELARFTDAYARTLERYRAAFGSAPPIDLWPEPSARFAARSQRVDRERFWFVQKPAALLSPFALADLRLSARRLRTRWLGLAWISLMAAGCSLIQGIPPFHRTGPSFLAFFVWAWLGSALFVWGLRQTHAARYAGASSPQLDDYETAYLAGGSVTVARAIIATLVQRGQMTIRPVSQRLVANACVSFTGHPLELVAWQRCCGAGARVAAVQDSVAGACDELASSLEQSGLLFPRSKTRRWLQLLMVVPCLGVIKAVLGVSNGRPIGFLILLLIASFTIGIRWLGPRVQRTAAGEQLLERLRARAARVPVNAEPRADQTATVGLSVALLGLGVLANTALADLGPLLGPGSSGADSGGGGGGCSGGGGGGGCGGCGGS